MSVVEMLVPAQQLAATNQVHYPDDGQVSCDARNALLAEEIELRRHIVLAPCPQLCKDF